MSWIVLAIYVAGWFFWSRAAWIIDGEPPASSSDWLASGFILLFWPAIGAAMIGVGVVLLPSLRARRLRGWGYRAGKRIAQGALAFEDRKR